MHTYILYIHRKRERERGKKELVLYSKNCICKPIGYLCIYLTGILLLSLANFPNARTRGSFLNFQICTFISEGTALFSISIRSMT